VEHVAQEAHILGAAASEDDPHRLGVQGLGELNAVAVRVEHIHKPDLPVQLEDDSYLHPGVAQSFCLGLHIGDVDMGDTA
jgi:hypothetical protein